MTKEPAPQSGAETLSDLEALVSLTRQKSQAGRNAVFETVQDLFLQRKDNLSDRERALMSDMLRQLRLSLRWDSGRDYRDEV